MSFSALRRTDRILSKSVKAITIQAPRLIEQAELAPPQLSPQDVLLRVLVVGLCGTDLNTYRGLNPLVSYPRVPGHEIGAVIEQCGPEVPVEWKPGMVVTCSPYSSCGTCSACEKGRFNACKYNQTLGVQRDGALTEYLAVSWRKLFYAPGMTAAECALVEPLAVGFHAASRGNPQPTDTVLVIGNGVVGLGAIAGAARLGARQVIAVDVSDSKLRLALKAGATASINSSTGDLQASLMRLTEAKGADIVIEAVGKAETFLAAVDHVCYAGRVVYVGYASQPVTYETKHFLLKELSIEGSRGSTPQDLQTVIDILREGAYPVRETITHTVSFDKTSAALADWDANPGDVTKIQIQVSESP